MAKSIEYQTNSPYLFDSLKKMRDGDVILVKKDEKSGFDVFRKSTFFRVEYYDHNQRISCVLWEIKVDDVQKMYEQIQVY